jgi:hypothetical protein
MAADLVACILFPHRPEFMPEHEIPVHHVFLIVNTIALRLARGGLESYALRKLKCAGNKPVTEWFSTGRAVLVPISPCLLVRLLVARARHWTVSRHKFLRHSDSSARFHVFGGKVPPSCFVKRQTWGLRDASRAYERQVRRHRAHRSLNWTSEALWPQLQGNK